MRMWMVDPRILCRKHLLGEHGEIHKHRHNFVKRHSMTKRIALGQIEVRSMQKRHDQLAQEMVRRGYNHQSPYEQPDINYLNSAEQGAKVNKEAALDDLLTRCNDCRQRTLKLKRTS